jgi:hypothetical protein
LRWLFCPSRFSIILTSLPFSGTATTAGRNSGADHLQRPSAAEPQLYSTRAPPLPRPIPRPIAQTLRAPKPNLLRHFDYLFKQNGLGGNYILVLKDDFSSYVHRFLTSAADALTTARALTDWFSIFGACRDWVRDRVSHFPEEVVTILKEQSRCLQLVHIGVLVEE